MLLMALIIVISASVFHISRGEASLIGMNIFFLLLAAFVAWGRSKRSSYFTKSLIKMERKRFFIKKTILGTPTLLLAMDGISTF